MIRIQNIIQVTYTRNEQVRDSLATISAHTIAGYPEALKQASTRLEQIAHNADRDSQPLQRLLRHLGAKSMLEAAGQLCRGGRPEAAHAMMALNELIQQIREEHIELKLLVEECLSSIHAAQQHSQSHRPGGHLLGSA